MAKIRKFSEDISNLKKTIKEAKEKLLDKIISDNTLSKVEKLEIISDNQLFGVSSWVENIFDIYKPLYIKEIEKNRRYVRPSYGDPIIDDFICSGYDRYQTVKLSELARMAYDEELEDQEEEGSSGLITILSNRTTDDVYKISKYEFIDTIYDWCIKNKTIGFKVDW